MKLRYDDSTIPNRLVVSRNSIGIHSILCTAGETMRVFTGSFPHSQTPSTYPYVERMQTLEYQRNEH